MSSAARPATPATGASIYAPPPPEAHPDPVPAAQAEMSEALRRDQMDLQREVILWQRWVRYGAVAVLGTIAFVLARPATSVLPLLGAIGAAYVGVVAASAWLVRDASRIRGRLLPALLATADVAALASLFHLISAPADQDRLLVVGLLVVQLAVFYFGWRLATWVAGLVGIAFVLSSLVLVPIVPGPRPALTVVALALALFGGSAAVLIATFGRFRMRMNRLRLYCKLVEEGEPAGALRLGEDRFPDGLTLVGRSFEAMRERLAEQIGTDPLTGCLNRRALEMRLRNDWRLARRRGSHVAVLAIDLDHFKEINDSRGHPTGDLVLQQLAGIMKATARDTDAVARLGGDEFVILLPDTAWQGALTFGERLRRRVDDFTFGPATEPVTLTISIGIALARGTDPISADVLLQEADRSLYKAKTGGRNRVFA